MGGLALALRPIKLYTDGKELYTEYASACLLAGLGVQVDNSFRGF
jgi:hypothetical protein